MLQNMTSIIEHNEPKEERLTPATPPVDKIAEEALSLLYGGLSLRGAADKMGISHMTVAKHCTSTPAYEVAYARAMLCRGVIYADEIVSIPDALPADPTQGQIAKAKMQVEARQWTGTKFWHKLSPEVQARANINIGNASGQPTGLTINIVANPNAAKTEAAKPINV